MKFGKKILSCLLVGATLFGMTALSTGTASAASTKVENLSITEKDSGKLVLKWKPVSGAQGYYVKYSNDNKFRKSKKTVQIKIKGKNNVKYTTPKFTGEFYAKVRAYKVVKGKTKVGNFSNIASTYILSKKDFGNEKNQKIKVWVPSQQVSLVKKQCNTFKKKFSSLNMKIDVVSTDESSASVHLLNDPYNSADIMATPCDQTYTLAKSKVIKKVPNAISRVINFSDTSKSNEAFKYGGYLFTYPLRTNGYYLVYNKSVVSASQAKTLEGILSACKKKGKKFVMDTGNGYYSCTFAFTGGVKINGFDGNGKQKFSSYDKSTAVATLKAFSKLMHKYSDTFVSQDVGNVSASFSNGKFGAGIDGCWNAASHKDYLGKNYRTAKLPTITVNGKKRQMVSLMGYVGMSVNYYSDYPKTSQALAYYLTAKQSQKDMAKTLKLAPTKEEIINSSIVADNHSMSALKAQEKYSIPQNRVADTFWNPMGILGMELYSCDNPDTYNYSNLLSKTISNIKG